MALNIYAVRDLEGGGGDSWLGRLPFPRFTTLFIRTSPYHFSLKVFSDDGLSHYIDGQSDPENWMKFVNCARHSEEQNLALVQDGDQLYYECCKDICVGEELLVWYGSCYTLSMGIPVGLNVDAVKEGVSPDPEFTGNELSSQAGNELNN